MNRSKIFFACSALIALFCGVRDGEKIALGSVAHAAEPEVYCAIRADRIDIAPIPYVEKLRYDAFCTDGSRFESRKVVRPFPTIITRATSARLRQEVVSKLSARGLVPIPDFAKDRDG